MAIKMHSINFGESNLKMNLQDDDQLLEAASLLAYTAIEKVNDDLTKLQQPLQTVYCVYHATGIIDHGGFLHFFESDFPCHPPYSCFFNALQKIGCEEQARALQVAVESFGLPDPENHISQRLNFMEAHFDEKTQTITVWDDCIRENDEVWTRLATWIRNQPELIKLIQQ